MDLESENQEWTQVPLHTESFDQVTLPFFHSSIWNFIECLLYTWHSKDIENTVVKKVQTLPKKKKVYCEG